jgi:hypothetical protein
MWFTHFTEADQGTIVKFTNGESITVEEDFMMIAQACSGGLR